MEKIASLMIVTIVLAYLSRASLRAIGSHGFYRFFAWETIGALIILNIDVWFRDPFAWYQLISWFLLVISFIPLAFGVRSLVAQGKPVENRAGEPQLLAFEKTSTLVTSGIYRYIRHPLYSSLLFLAWGVYFKAPYSLGILLALAATIFLVLTAKADEAECIRFFGPGYQAYMKTTGMFVPYIF